VSDDRTSLPPAGHARDEALRERADALEEQAETRANAEERYAIDPKAFRVENELAQHFDELSVSNPDPAFAYCWVWTGRQGYFIKAKQAIRVEEDSHMQLCWEVVQGAMVEAEELKDVTGLRRLGDVILMRCRRDRYRKLQQREAQKRQAQSAGIDGRLREQAEEINRRVPGLVTVHDINDPAVSHALKRAQAQSIAKQQFTTQLRDGTLGQPMTPRR